MNFAWKHLIKQQIMDKVFYPYNTTFKYYAEPRAGKRATQFVDENNKLKGGVWVLHTKEQYNEWYNAKGKHLEYIELGLRYDYKGD